MTQGYPLDMATPVSYVATALDRAAPAALSVGDLVAGYIHPIGSDLTRVRLHEGAQTDGEANTWIIRRALDLLGDQVAWDGNGYVLAVPFDRLVCWGNPVARQTGADDAKLGDPFNPLTGGTFAENVRLGKSGGHSAEDAELRESMLAAGWLPGHPAIVDERGVTIVGHRRLIVAKELGIEPDILKINFGTGDAADIRRLQLAWLSNTGGKPNSPSDRRKMAAYMASRGWTQRSIAEALNVAQRTIERDLANSDISVGISDVGQAVATGHRQRRPGAGRPRTRVLTPVPSPAPAAEPVAPPMTDDEEQPTEWTVTDATTWPLFRQGESPADVRQTTGLSKSKVWDSRMRWVGANTGHAAKVRRLIAERELTG